MPGLAPLSTPLYAVYCNPPEVETKPFLPKIGDAYICVGQEASFTGMLTM